MVAADLAVVVATAVAAAMATVVADVSQPFMALESLDIPRPTPRHAGILH